MTEKVKPIPIKDQVQEWLIKDGWSVRDEPSSDALWAYLAEDRQLRKIVIGQPAGREDWIVIQAVVNIDDVTKERISQMPPSDRERFLWDLRFELLKTDLEFDGIMIPLERIGVARRIFLESLTKDLFFQIMSQVRKGVLLIQWMVARRFAEEPPQIGYER